MQILWVVFTVLQVSSVLLRYLLLYFLQIVTYVMILPHFPSIALTGHLAHQLLRKVKTKLRLLFFWVRSWQILLQNEVWGSFELIIFDEGEVVGVVELVDGGGGGEFGWNIRVFVFVGEGELFYFNFIAFLYEFIFIAAVPCYFSDRVHIEYVCRSSSWLEVSYISYIEFALSSKVSSNSPLASRLNSTSTCTETGSTSSRAKGWASPSQSVSMYCFLTSSNEIVWSGLERRYRFCCGRGVWRGWPVGVF